jgi:phospholipid/cholesterol/gamma-HCH transport system permease protein
MIGAISRLGGLIGDAAVGAGFSIGLFGHTTLQLPRLFTRQAFRSLLRQLYACGILSIPVTLVVAICTGAIVAMNTGLALEELGQQRLISRVIAISMAREMGPFMTGLTLAASVGSAMAAEIGTMKVSEEVDALEVMGIDPARFLVLPRLVAMTVMTPILTIYFILVGTLGGALITASRFGVTFHGFVSDVEDFLDLKDIYTGLLKSLVFGIIIAVVGCSQGLRAHGGAIGVGLATRRSVVISFLLIIIIGYFITFLAFELKW